MRTVVAQSGTLLQLHVAYKGREWKMNFHRSSLLLGRTSSTGKPDVDLSPDLNVSRRHARIWVEEGTCWVEDVGSKFGTLLDGSALAPQTKARLTQGSCLQVGATLVRISWSADASELTDAVLDPTLQISDSLDASLAEFDLAQTARPEVIRRAALLHELPVEFSAESRFDKLLQTIIKRVVEIIPGAERGSLLLLKPNTDSLLLAAFVSEEEPAVSKTLARRALTEQKGFIWRRGFEGDPAQSVQRHRIESGMYAPLLRHGRALGVISVDNPFRDSAFGDEDLRLLLGIAHEAAISVANHQFLLTFACHSVRVLPA